MFTEDFEKMQQIPGNPAGHVYVNKKTRGAFSL